MYLKYGTYQHANDEVAVAIRREATWSDGGFATGYRDVWSITGFLQATDQPSVTTAIAALVAAYQSQGFSAALYQNDGTATAHALSTTTSLSGVRSTGVSFPEGRGGEYSTYRSYAVELSAEYAFPGLGVISFDEEVTFIGAGGPDVVWLEPLNGDPQPQIVRQQTSSRAIQAGMAVGKYGCPNPPSPIWPQFELVKMRQIKRKTPKRWGPLGAPRYSDYQTTWHYEFQAGAPLAGNPNLWLA